MSLFFATMASKVKSKEGSRARNHDENREIIWAICYSESGLKASRIGIANRIFLQSTDARIAIAWDRLFDPEWGTGFT